MKRNLIYISAILIALLVVAISYLESEPSNESERDSLVTQLPAKHLYTPPSLPEVASFAKVSLSLNNPMFREALDKELLRNCYFHSNTMLLIKRSKRYLPFIDSILRVHNLPEDLRYIPVIESNLDPTARSPAKAVGLWQIMRGTALQYKLRINSEVDERCHVEKSTLVMVKYFQYLHKLFGQWDLVLAAYNTGLGKVKKKLKEQPSKEYLDIYFNQETNNYLFRLMAIKLIFENPSEYGFNVLEKDKYPVIATEKITVKEKVKLTDFAKEHGVSYKMLRYLNPWLKGNTLTGTRKSPYEIALPLTE